ncbi:MAG: Crp/Fnr family transcriptional regulator [Geobacteraceae bacterium]|nr:Crp/Fnr family transcriptional regulator [Geobacteraceae bacterium]
MIRKKFDPEHAKKIMKEVPLFSILSDQELSSLLDKTNVYSYHKNEIIILGGEENKQMYLVLKGQVRVIDIRHDGQERTMALRHRGDYFGEMGLIDGRTDSATVIATEPCQVLLIAKDVFYEFFLENKTKLLRVIDILCGRLRESWLFHTIIGINNADSKIKATLAHYSKTLGIKDTNGVIINSVFSHQSIADRVHITRETVTRELRKMREHHEIEMVGKRIKLLPAFYDKYEKSDLYKALVADKKKHGVR